MAQHAVHLNNGDARLQRVYIDQLSDIHAAEQQARGIFPDMATVAAGEDVAAVFRAAASETEVQLARLDGLLEALELEVDERVVAPSELLDDARQVLATDQEVDDQDDLLLRSARQSIRHQISGYESACSTARRLGDFRTLDVLLLSLDEELATDSLLSEIVSRRSRFLRAI